MNHDEILERIVAMCCETLEIQAQEVSEDSSFDSLGADSFDKLELVTALEDEFDLQLDDEVLQNIETVSDACQAIEQAQ